MNTRRRQFFLLSIAALALRGAEPAKPAEAATAAAEAEEVYVPERPSTTPAPPVAQSAPPVVSVPGPTKGAVPKATAGTTAPKGTTALAPETRTTTNTVPPLSPRFQQVRDRTKALYQHRGETPPKFDPRNNPFRASSAAPVAAVASVGAGGAPVAAATAAPAVASGDLALLKQAAATLKVAGTIQLGGVAHLIINQVPYKEGDVISARVKGEPAYLRVKNISRYSYTLSLNEAELSVKY